MREVRTTVRDESGEVIGDWITDEHGEHRPVVEDFDHNRYIIKEWHGPAPQIVCLCGSTRFFDEFMAANYALTMQGFIVLSVGFYGHSADRVHGQDVGVETEEQKVVLDELHKRKIDLADRVFVINKGGYVGESTRSEIDYADLHGKPIDFLEPLPVPEFD